MSNKNLVAEYRVVSVIINPEEQQYLICGVGIPNQRKLYDEFGEWNTILDANDDPVLDCQIDFDDSVELENENHYYQFQTVNLVDDPDEDGMMKQGSDWQNPSKLFITNHSIQDLLSSLED